jgi:hypothetical protein
MWGAVSEAHWATRGAMRRRLYAANPAQCAPLRVADCALQSCHIRLFPSRLLAEEGRREAAGEALRYEAPPLPPSPRSAGRGESSGG